MSGETSAQNGGERYGGYQNRVERDKGEWRAKEQSSRSSDVNKPIYDRATGSMLSMQEIHDLVAQGRDDLEFYLQRQNRG